MQLPQVLLRLWPALCCVLLCLSSHRAAPEGRPAGARALLQAADGGGGCALRVGPQNTQFSNCTSVKTTPQAVAYTRYYTLPAPGSTSLISTDLKGGLEGAAGAVGGQWAGFGIPAAVGQVLVMPVEVKLEHAFFACCDMVSTNADAGR